MLACTCNSDNCESMCEHTCTHTHAQTHAKKLTHLVNLLYVDKLSKPLIQTDPQRSQEVPVDLNT